MEPVGPYFESVYNVLVYYRHQLTVGPEGLIDIKSAMQLQKSPCERTQMVRCFLEVVHEVSLESVRCYFPLCATYLEAQ